MIGKWTLTVDTRPHCCNGWNPTKRKPSCSYTGGHSCDLLLDHTGPCRCSCGSTTKRNHWKEEQEKNPEVH